MRHAKVFSLFVFVAVLCYGAIGFYFLPIATFQGELARMGLLPDTLFGWTKPQPAIDINLLKQSSMQEADVLVVGDSFSETRVWQSVLTQHGLKVRTEPWDSIRGICADFTPWLREQGFKGKYVVLEIVERNIVDGLAKSVACQHMQYHPNAHVDSPRSPPVVSYDVNYRNYSGKFSIAFQTQLNAWKYERIRRNPDFKTWVLNNDVKMARLPNGCELFSHASCNDALFLAYDKQEEVDAGVLENIEKLNTRLNGITPIWTFIPNKSTAYLYPDKQFWNVTERRFHAPNLLRMTQQAIARKVIDLYPANNTHFSTTGYLLVGEAVFKALQQAQAHTRLR
jgi:hypothetical protein